MNKSMTFLAGILAAAVLMFSATPAMARVDVGLNIGVPGHVYVQPHPVYVQQRPVYVHQRPVYVHQRPVYYAPQHYYGDRHYHKYHKHHKHHRHHRHHKHHRHGHDRDDD